MTEQSKADLVKKVILGVRQHGISSVLFRNLIGDRLGLNVTDMECLGLLFHKGISTPSELARHTGLSSGATTAMLDRLERSGLIERRRNPDDRRGTLIALVNTNTEKIDRWFSSSRQAQNELVASFTEEQLAVLYEFFERSTQMWDEERRKLMQATSEAADLPE